MLNKSTWFETKFKLDLSLNLHELWQSKKMFTDHLSLIIISVSAHACSLQTQLLCYIDSSDLHSGTTAFYYYFTIAPKHPVPAQGHSAVSTDQRKIGSSLFPPYKQSHEVKPTSLNLHDILACHINRTYPPNMLHVFMAMFFIAVWVCYTFV